MQEKKAKLKQEEATLKEEAEKRRKSLLEEQARRRKMENDREWLNSYIQTIHGTSSTGGTNAVVAAPKITEEDLEQFNREEIVARRHAEMYKKRSELLEKANNKAKKLDHLVRACRLEEIPLLKAAALREAEERLDLFEKTQQEIEEASKREHEEMLKNRDRLKRMRPEITVVNKALKALAAARYKEKFAEWEALRTRVRAERLTERAEAERKRQAELEEEEKTRAEREEKEAAEAAVRAEEELARRRTQEATEAEEQQKSEFWLLKTI